MWFEFPEGAERISVNQQEFSTEHTSVEDDKTRHFFRAPDHFAAQILDLPGFRAVAQPKDTDLEDLPKADPQRDQAIGQLSGQVSTLIQERDDARAAVDPLRRENAELRKRVLDLERALEVATQKSEKK